MAVEAVELETELLEVARAGARAGGAELLAGFSQPHEVEFKSTATDPVSEVDVAAERAIRAAIAARRPGDAILGEEGGVSDGDPDAGGEALRWTVDPLDGTVNYLYGIPAFAVCVSAADDAGPLAGVVYDPVREECFAATRSGPAVLTTAAGAAATTGEQLHGSRCARLDRALVATGFGYDATVRAAQGQVVAALLPRARDIRRAGAASLDLAWLAAGRLDAYYERGVKPWDVTAGMLICERAGMLARPLPSVSDPAAGAALPGGVIVAPPALLDELLALVDGAHPAR